MNISNIISAMLTKLKTYTDNKVADIKKYPYNWNETNSSNKGYIKNKPTALPANGGNVAKVSGYSIWTGTQSQYDAISVKDDSKLYFITDNGNGDDDNPDSGTTGNLKLVENRYYVNQEIHGGFYNATTSSNGIRYSPAHFNAKSSNWVYATFSNQLDLSKYKIARVTVCAEYTTTARVVAFTRGYSANTYGTNISTTTKKEITKDLPANVDVTFEFNIEAFGIAGGYFGLGLNTTAASTIVYIKEVELVAKGGSSSGSNENEKVLLGNGVNSLGNFRVLYEYAKDFGTKPVYQGSAYMEGSNLVTRFGVSNSYVASFEGYQCSLATVSSINVSGYKKLQFTIVDGSYGTSATNAYIRVGLGSNPSSSNYYPTVYKTLTGVPGANIGTYTVDISSFTSSNSTAYLMFYFDVVADSTAAYDNRYWFSEIKLIGSGGGSTGGSTLGKGWSEEFQVGRYDSYGSVNDGDPYYARSTMIPTSTIFEGSNNCSITFNGFNTTNYVTMHAWNSGGGYIGNYNISASNNTFSKSQITNFFYGSSVAYLAFTVSLEDPYYGGITVTVKPV